MARTLCAMALIGSLASAPSVKAADGCPDAIMETFGERSGRACAIAWCETGGTYDPMSTGALGERGLFQFLRSTWLGTDIGSDAGWDAAYDPGTNILAAFELSRGGVDWRQWSCQ